MKAALTIVALDVIDSDAYRSYARAAGTTIAVYGGTVRASGRNTEVLEGDWAGLNTVVIEWPSHEAAKAWYDSAEYQELIPRRQAAARGDLVMVHCRS